MRVGNVRHTQLRNPSSTFKGSDGGVRITVLFSPGRVSPRTPTPSPIQNTWFSSGELERYFFISLVSAQFLWASAPGRLPA